MPSSDLIISYAGLTAGPEEIAHIRNIAQQYSWLSRKEIDRHVVRTPGMAERRRGTPTQRRFGGFVAPGVSGNHRYAGIAQGAFTSWQA
jgi:hypothetical protein